MGPTSEAALWWVALQEVEGIGAARMMRLARVFGSPQAAARAAREELVCRARLTEEQADGVRRVEESLPMLRARIRAWRAQGISLIEMGDERYPCGLRDLRTPPPVLYVRGTLAPEDERAVAVVGTRQPSREGARLARELAEALASRGFTIVSGLARGIDTAGHRGALAVEDGRTIAVLGSGVMQVYPPENQMLAARVVKRGCLMAEVPPETRVEGRLLLARDRIQAALARAVIVVQGQARCGSMTTARHALACGRLVFAAPWTEPPFAEGWERLRAMGARTVGRGSDLDALAEEIASEPRAGGAGRLV